MSAFKIGDGVSEKYKLFRRGNAASAALVLKVDKDEETVVLDEEYPDMTPEDLQDELSDSAPRWILWSVKIERDDGRVQYPLILVFFSPESCNQRQKMLYSSCTPFISQTLDVSGMLVDLAMRFTERLNGWHDAIWQITKVHELKDLDDLTFEKLKEFHAASVTR